jgi:Protein of unknown function (DUF1257)
VEAIKEMGYHPQVSEKAQHLEGYHGDQRQQTAEIIIKRREVGGASNDVGFKRNADGTFTAIISDYDKSATFNAKKQQQLKCIYTEKVAMKQAKNNGLKFVGKKTVNDTKTGKPVQRLQFVTTR